MTTLWNTAFRQNIIFNRGKNMLKKIIVIIAMLAIIAFSFSLYKKSTPQLVAEVSTPEEQIEAVVVEEKFPEDIFTFSIKDLPENCSLDNAQFCAVENSVKCTINPDLKLCADLKLPEFIFMKDPSIDRPSEISYKIINKKVLPNGTTEIYTESACNGNWFGLCQGTVIYVISPLNEKWQVKDIYAIE